MCAGRWPSRSTVGTVKRISTRLPSLRAVTSAGAAGALAYGTSGGPFLPHAVVTSAASTHAYATGRIGIGRDVRDVCNGWLRCVLSDPGPWTH